MHRTKNIKSCKGKGPSNIQKYTYQTQMPAEDTVTSKILNQHRWRNQNIPGQNQIKISIYQSILTEDPRRKAPTQGRDLHQRKDKILSISQQILKERATSTKSHLQKQAYQEPTVISL